MLTEREKDYLQRLADRLRSLRKEKKLSQAQLAFEISTGRTHYTKIEKGLVNPGIILLMRLADTLEVHLSELLPDESG